MKQVFVVHNKFDHTEVLETESLTEAYAECDSRNAKSGNIDPRDLPFCVSSEFMADEYEIRGKIVN